MIRQAALAVLGLAASVVQSQAQAPCAMTYEVFETAVPHLDLETCPKDLGGSGRFCRASVGGDAVHVFAFSDEGERCLVASKSYPSGQYEFGIK